MRTSIVSAVTIVVLATSMASATTYEDPNDTRGPLDIRRASFVMLRDPARLRFTVQTHDDWTRERCRRAIQRNDACTILFWLDTRGGNASRTTGEGIDYWLWWRISDCALMVPYTETVLATGAAGKTPDSATCTIRRRHVDVEKNVRWYVSTAWWDRTYLLDYAPDVGWYG